MKCLRASRLLCKDGFQFVKTIIEFKEERLYFAWCIVRC